MLKGILFFFYWAYFSAILWAEQIDTTIPYSYDTQQTFSFGPGFNSLIEKVIGFGLIVSLGVVVYHMSNNTPQAKKALVNWLVAFLIQSVLLGVFMLKGN